MEAVIHNKKQHHELIWIKNAAKVFSLQSQCLFTLLQVGDYFRPKYQCKPKSDVCVCYFSIIIFFPIIPSITMWCVQCSVYTYMQLQWHHIIKTYLSLLECCAGVVKDILYSLSPNVGQNERQRGRGGKCEKKKSSRTNNLPKESC